jgi:hypothetical protein
MSQFLSNILNRHSQSDHNIQPRGLGVFETQGSWSESLNSETDVNPIDHNVITSPIENSGIEPRQNMIISPEAIQNTSSKQNNKSNRQEPHQRIDTPYSKTRQVKNSILKNMPFKTEKAPPKNPDISQAEAYFGERTKEGNNNLKPVPYKLEIPKPDKKFPHENDKQVKTQSNLLDFTDQILVKPNKEMKNSFPPNYTVNMQNGNGIKGLYSEETSKEDQVPTIKIHIGRIDIKAVKQPDLTLRKAEKTNKSTLSLDQFLKKREPK